MTTNTEIRHGHAVNVNCVIDFTWVYKLTSSASAEKVTPVCFGSEALSDTPYGRMIFTCFLQPRKEDKTHQFFSTYASCYFSTLSLLSLLVHYTLHTTHLLCGRVGLHALICLIYFVGIKSICCDSFLLKSRTWIIFQSSWRQLLDYITTFGLHFPGINSEGLLYWISWSRSFTMAHPQVKLINVTHAHLSRSPPSLSLLSLPSLSLSSLIHI